MSLKPHQRVFLKAYVMTGSVVKASELSKVQRGRHYDWLEREEYAKAFERARLECGDALEEAVMERAKDGVLEPVFYQGKPCGAIRRFSDGNAQFLLRGLKPDVYCQRLDTPERNDAATVTKVTYEWIPRKPQEPVP